MIITVRGTDHNSNKAAHTLALLAGYNAAKYKRKTLVLQLTAKVSVSDILVGNKKQLEMDGGSYSYDESGIDSLFRTAELSGIRKEGFDTYCIPVIESSPNLLDVAKETGIDNFEETLLQKESLLKSIIDQAKKVYDDIFIYANGENKLLLAMINRHTDKEIICVRQGNKQTVSEVLEDSIYVITSYDENSSMNFKYIKRMYDLKRVSYIPYSVQMKDAYNNGVLMQFILSNINLSEEDVNFNVERSADIILEQINNGITPVKETTECFDQYIEKKQKELGEAIMPDVQYIEKKRFLKKSVEVAEKFGKSAEIASPNLNDEAEIEMYDDPDSENADEEMQEYDETESSASMNEQNESDEQADSYDVHSEDKNDESSNEAADDQGTLNKNSMQEKEADTSAGFYYDDEEFDEEKLSLVMESSPFDDEEDHDEEQSKEKIEYFTMGDPAEVASSSKTEYPAAKEEETEKLKPAISNSKIKYIAESFCDCGEVIEPGYKFCPECGKKIEKDWECSCGHLNRFKARYCTECGHARG